MSVKKQLTPSKTVLTIVVGFLIIYLVGRFRLLKDFTWALWVSAIIGVLGLLSSYLALKIQDAWMGLASILSRIIPPILLSVIFFVILFPIALLSRLFGDKDPLQLKKTDKSLFKTVDKTCTKDTFEKTW
ncbi:SxtJ family membrane protein [uncultured Dokdonia sp.]|uniref:SxtJ family membrane protein n=1 Tax=uncultured Dokdonia sp. TaxID=575653 RepID=UPI00261B3E49|nr:SxtJ family membrane protein [uncultured Dokdonia sp.]